MSDALVVNYIAWHDTKRRRMMKVKVREAVERFNELTGAPPAELVLSVDHREAKLGDTHPPVRFDPMISRGVVYVGTPVDGQLGLVRQVGPDIESTAR